MSANLRYNPELVQGIIAGGSEAIYKAVEGVEDNEELGRCSIQEREITDMDVIIGITASGRTPFVLGAIREAKKRGAATIGISNCHGSRIQDEVDKAITVLVGPEVIMGSTRMKSGTSQKLVLNMITTTLMIKLGRVYGNLMVDLQPTNEKLFDRAIRIIMCATDISYEEAEKFFELSELNPKIAIVMVKTGLSRANAEKLLKKGEDFVTKAVNLHNSTLK